MINGNEALAGFKLTEVDWEAEESVLTSLRREVFILEQNVPQDEEWDGKDKDAWHWLVTDPEGKPVATARLVPASTKSGITIHAQIGRMAVLADYRGKGVGAAMLEEAVKKAESQGFTSVFLNAQTHATNFYQKAGFEEEGESFLEAGISHKRMVLNLNGSTENPEEDSASSLSSAVQIKAFDTAEVDWKQASTGICEVREAVLTQPQAIISDETDNHAMHWVAQGAEGQPTEGQIMGVIRMTHEGAISHLAVLPEHRLKGIGYSLLDLAVTRGRRFGLANVTFSAPSSLSEFFAGAGFAQTGAGDLDLQNYSLQLSAQTAHKTGQIEASGISEGNNELDGYAPVYVLGETNQVILLRKEADFRNIILEMSAQARSTIKIHAPLLDHKLYDNPELRENLSALARRNRYTEIQILIYDSHRMVKNGHRLMELGRKLSSSISVRLVHPDYRQSNHEYTLVDSEGVVFRLDYDVYEGYANFKDLADANRLAREFRRAWDTSLYDPNLRQLSL